MSDVLDFQKDGGLIAAVVQDVKTRRVLMVGYMNHEAFDKTVATGHVTFFSCSRQKLWTKGESSGHFLVLKSMAADCDGDASSWWKPSRWNRAFVTKGMRVAFSASMKTASGA